MTKWKVDSSTTSADELKEILENPSNKIQQLAMEVANTKINESTPITSEGFKDPLLDVIWREAKAVRAGHTTYTGYNSHSAELWSFRIAMWAPGYYNGWRKMLPKLIHWLENL